MVTLPPLERGLRLLELISSSNDGITYKQAHQYLKASTATTARLLKVLTKMEYIIQDNGYYKPGLALQRLSHKNNVQWVLTHHGNILAEELADSMNESCVVAVYNDGYFEFTGIKIIEYSFSYGKEINKIYPSRGHVFTMIAHAMMLPEDAKKYFSQEDIFYNLASNPPSWKNYVESVVYGMESGHFMELGWRRSHLFRTAIPVFSENHELAGAFFCGFSSQKKLMDNLDIFMNASFKVLARFNDYQSIFDCGMKKLSKNLDIWQKELE